MSVSTASGSRIEVSPRTAFIAAGDLAAILLFVAVGEYTHGYDPLVDVGRVAGTFAPFLVGWALLAVVGGLYAQSEQEPLLRIVVRTLGIWIGAVLVAQGLRATAFFHGDAAVAFAVVSILVGGALLCGWRVAIALAGRYDR